MMSSSPVTPVRNLAAELEGLSPAATAAQSSSAPVTPFTPMPATPNPPPPTAGMAPATTPATPVRGPPLNQGIGRGTETPVGGTNLHAAFEQAAHAPVTPGTTAPPPAAIVTIMPQTPVRRRPSGGGRRSTNDGNDRNVPACRDLRAAFEEAAAATETDDAPSTPVTYGLPIGDFDVTAPGAPSKGIKPHACRCLFGTAY